MGIFPAYCEMLEAMAPISGDVVTIGRQTIEKNCQDWAQTDVELFKRFGANTIRALDISDYEGAEILHDLNEPLPGHLHGIADFVFEGSCLDNIFDSAQAIRSLSKLLKPNGRIFLVEHSTSCQGALVMFSPEWFFNFFAVNDYEDCQLTLFSFDNLNGPWRKHHWYCYLDDQPAPTTPRDLFTNLGDFLTVAVARKGPNSTDDRMPVQAQYRKMHHSDDDVYLQAHKRFMRYASEDWEYTRTVAGAPFISCRRA